MCMELCDFKLNSSHYYNMSIEEINNFQHYYESLSDEKVLNMFVNKFIGNFKNIIVKEDLDSFIKNIK